jgi:hypothetical protein
VNQPAQSRSLEDFRGDFEQLAAMMEASWQDNVTPAFLYTAPFLANLFDYPGASFSLAPTLYVGPEPIAFVAGFPRRVLLGGKELHVLVVALLTVASSHKSKGYGIVVWSELVRRGRAAGLDGVVNYCVDGEAMDRMIEGSCRRLGIPVSKIYSVSYLSRVLWRPGAAVDGAECEVSATQLMDAASGVAARVPLARTWTASEAAWQCSREGVVCAYREGPEASRALLTGYVMPIANRDRTRSLIVEDVFWGDLDQGDRKALAAELVAKGAAAGAQVAIVPDLGYADMSPFAAAKFKPSGRTIHAYLSLWSETQSAESLSGYYLDVF